ncbi:MAG: folate-binding protein YgfZ [Oleiphilaceae bacterium]|nr:folate-binding protein YgfZ [Oleiphilaceae bacterium]
MAAATPSLAHHPLPGQGWAPLSSQIVLRVSGAGTDKFLHGQFSQNLKDVSADNAPRAAACNPKGRAYALVRMVRHGDDVVFNLPVTLADQTTAHLKKFLMLFRGTTMTTEPEAGIIGILGHALADRLSPGAPDRLDTPGRTENLGEHRLLRTQDTAEGTPRYEFWQLGEMTATQKQALEAESQLSEADWQASEIRAGVPWLTPGTRESFVPQMLNWQHLQGVHFNKGCYTGQEVIARMHFLGQLKKSLFRLRTGPVNLPPVPGEPVVVDERAVGEVVNAVQYADGSIEALAVLRHDSTEKTLLLGNDRQPATVLPLPYTVTERAAVAKDT